MSSRFAASGLTDQAGIRRVHVRDGLREAWVEPSDTANLNKLCDLLASHGIIVSSKADREELQDEIGSVADFPAARVLRRSGHHRDAFVLPSPGDPQDDHRGVIRADGTELSPVIFAGERGKCVTRGSLKQWKRAVAKPLKGQSLPIFVVALAFTGPLLKIHGGVDNPGFNLVGPKGTGKSTIQAVAASVLGSPGLHYGNNYSCRLGGLTSDWAAVAAVHRDLTMVVDDVDGSLAALPPAEQKRIIRNLLTGPCAGAADHGRMAVLISSNLPLTTIASDEALTQAVAHRWFTLMVDAGNGVFDHVPKELGSASAYADTLRRSAERYHGTAIRCFLRRLVQELHDKSPEVRDFVDRGLRRVRTHLKVDQNDGAAVRAANAFGIVYVAGKLAQNYGVLPRSLNIGKAVTDVYRLYTEGLPDTRTIHERLEAIAAGPDVITLDKQQRHCTAEQLLTARAIVRVEGLARELWVTREQSKRLDDWSKLLRDAKSADLLMGDCDHDNSQHRIVKGTKKKTRVYRFRLVESASPTLFPLAADDGEDEGDPENFADDFGDEL